MKFIHTGDIHLGCMPDIGSQWSHKRHTDIWRTFEDIIKQARDNNIPLLLICGDLFHRQPLLKEIKEVNQLFASASGTQFVITAGNHDYMVPGSPYFDFEWSSNVHFLNQKELSVVEFKELGIAVHGFSYYANELTGQDISSVYSSLVCPKDDLKHILMLHGGDSKHLPLDYDSLARSGFDYIALGHIHKPKIFEDSAMAFCGSPEPLDRTERGPHGYIIVSLDDSTAKFNCKFKAIAKASYVSCRIKITEDTTISSLRNTISHIISEKGADNIYLLTLFGTRSPELFPSLKDFNDLGSIIEVIDESLPDYDLDMLCTEHNGDLIERFINKITEGRIDTSELDETRKNALYYGLDALMSGTKDGGAR